MTGLSYIQFFLFVAHSAKLWCTKGVMPLLYLILLQQAYNAHFQLYIFILGLL